MATTQTLYATASAQLRYTSPGSNFSSDSSVRLADAQNPSLEGPLLVSFAELPSSLQYRALLSITLYAYVQGIYSTAISYTFSELLGDFDAATVTANNAPGCGSYAAYSNTGSGFLAAEASGRFDNIANVLRHGVLIMAGSYPATCVTSRGSNKPYVVVTFQDDEVTPILSAPSPTAGYLPKHKANTFSWRLDTRGRCVGEVTQAGAVFRWRAEEGGAVTEISCGTAQSCTVPAGTFTSDSIQWQVELTTNTGQTVTGSWYTISTAEPTSAAAIVSPKDTILDGAADSVFAWTHIISTGTAQTAAELQCSQDGSIWTALGRVTGDAASLVVPAGTLPGGTVWWRVRTYNTDSAPGEWSDAAELIVVAAPAAPVVSVVSGPSPRPVVAWQATGQQAFEVQLGDAVASGVGFGIDKQWRCPDYLPDGDYIARVRVANSYGLWSAWGSCALTVANAPGGDIVLTAAASHVVELRWAAEGYAAYYVLRDGTPIAKTTGNAYVDNFSTGTHSYQVRGVLDTDGDYGLSNAIQAAAACDTVYISPAPQAAWQRLLLADTADRATGVTLGREVELVQISGAAFPVAERAEFRSHTMRCVCAFTDRAQAAALEALVGELVCIKDRWGNMVVGVMDILSKGSARFYQTYNFAVTQVDFREAVAYD